MDKFLISILILISIVTGVVFITAPKLHAPLIVVDYNFVFVDEQANNNEEKVVKAEKKPDSIVRDKNKQSQPAPQKGKPSKSKVDTKIKEQKPVNSNKNSVKNNKTTEEVKEPVLVVEKETKEVVEDVENKQEVEAPINVIRQLTEEEEIIAWNKWRSDLQNQVMKDTQISAPIGVAFKFSFTVDKFGNLSNVKVWSTVDAYSEAGVRAIKPVLMSYQGKPILNFPLGTKRVITNVAGGFVMSTTTGYSRPSDYSDYERVKK